MSDLAAPLAFDLGGDPIAIPVVDHVAAALSRLRAQYRSGDPDSPSTWERLLAALARPALELEYAAQQLLLLRSIYTATGIWLERIGAIVGQSKGDLDDEVYRRLLFARIATNRSTGRRADLIKIAKLVLNDSAARIAVTSPGIATGVVEIVDVAVLDELAGILFGFLADGTADGVRLIVQTSPDVMAESFALGVTAYPSGALTAGATTILVGSTAEFPTSGTLDIDVGLAEEETVAYSGKTSTSFFVAPLANNHQARCAIQLVEPWTGKGLDTIANDGQPNVNPYSDVGTDGGTLANARTRTAPL